MATRRYAEVTPLLLSMVSRAAHVNRWEPPKIVQEKIDGHEVMCIGSNVVRNGLDGDCLTVMIRWRIDGKPATRRTVYERFGRMVQQPSESGLGGWFQSTEALDMGK